MPRSGRPQFATDADRRRYEAIDPRWLLKAIGFTVLGALICGYATLCLLFYQGQWQLVLHPTRSPQGLTSFAGVPAVAVRFDASESGTPRLAGAWVAGNPAARYAAYTVLYLRGGDGTLAENAQDAGTIALLHGMGLNVFAFDYRGYGQSDPLHPNQARMTEDAEAALRYLASARGLAERQVVLFGTGVGASLAAHLAQAHPALPALVVDDPGPDPAQVVRRDPRTRALPVSLLFDEQFSMEPLASVPAPKLLISYDNSTAAAPAGFRAAREPKMTLDLAPRDRNDVMKKAGAIARFLDERALAAH